MGDVVKMFLIVTIFFSVGVLVLPSTVSLFAGQHVWYSLSNNTSDVPCEKCHADIVDEMKVLAGPHTGETGYEKFKCEYCHRVFPLEGPGDKTGDYKSTNVNQSLNSTYFHIYARVSSTKVQPGKEAHAASAVPCLYCHSGENSGSFHGSFVGGCSCHKGSHGHDTPEYFNDQDCWNCHHKKATGGVVYIPPAGGFGLTAAANDTGINASHYSFVMQAINNQTLTDANEACIACHTKIKLKINFNVTTEAKIVVNNSYTTASSYWDVADVSPSNYTTYEEVKG